MKIISTSDYFSVSLLSLVADYDKETITNLYQPIIGFEAAALYFSFLSEARNQEIYSMSTHGDFLNRLGMNIYVFTNALEKLEGIGLVKTYMEDENSKIYHYEVYAPDTPHDFFENTVFYGLLKQSIGDKEAERLKGLYKVNNIEEKGREISASFDEIYAPDMSNPILQASINEDALKERNEGNVNADFSESKFFSECKKLLPANTITEKSLSKKEMEEVRRMATLNGLAEEQMAQIIVTVYDSNKPKGERVDFYNLREKIIFSRSFRTMYKHPEYYDDNPLTVSSQTKLGQKINMMETEIPSDFLRYVSGMAEPASSDLVLIDDISKRYNFPNSVINVLIDYTLTTQNNTLPRKYVEKVAASLAREHVTCAQDAMNYLNNVSKKKRSKSGTPPRSSHSEELTNEESNIENNEISDEEWDALIKEIDNG